MAAPCEENVSVDVVTGDEFRQMDPIRFKNMVYKRVKICAANEYEHEGWIYTIDPVSLSIILAQCENCSPDGKLPLSVVMGHSITDITVLDNDTTKHKALLDKLFKDNTQTQSLSAGELANQKEKLKEWLKLHRVPVKECGEDNNSLSISDVLVIEPPYEPDNCLCKNEIILARVQALIRNMGDAS
nr:gem-associated protein 6-like [Lytechinus pictus]